MHTAKIKGLTDTIKDLELVQGESAKGRQTAISASRFCTRD